MAPRATQPKTGHHATAKPVGPRAFIQATLKWAEAELERLTGDRHAWRV